MRNKTNFKNLYTTLCSLLILILCTGAFYAFWVPFVRWNNNTGFLLGLGNLLMAGALFLLLTGGALHILGGLRIGASRVADLLTAQIVAFFMADVLEILLSCAITGQYRYWPDFLWRYFLLFLIESAGIGVLSYFLTRLCRWLFPPLRLVEIYGERTNNLDEKLETRRDLFRLARRLSCEADERELRAALRRYDAVLLNDLPGPVRNRLLKICYEMDKPVYFTPKLSDIIIKSSRELYPFDTPLYCRGSMELSIWERGIKRFFDVLISLLALILLLPLLLVVAAAIKLEDGGPVFFRQQRATLGGKVFWILKFRSMIDDAEADGKSHPAVDGDKRISRVGALIRPTRIDELPQLWNVLRGDMSIVGPRPERLEHVEAYQRQVPEFVYRLKMKGGLTGYAQVYGKYNTTPLDKLKLDLIYIANYSLLLDARIMLETVKILFKKESTEGFSENERERIENED